VNVRLQVAALSLSAAGLVGIAVHESFRDTAYIPVPGDVPTVGFGSTTGVRLGDRVTVERGLMLLAKDASNAEQAVRRCAPVPMFQHEFDAWTAFVFNVGEGAFCRSTAARLLNEGRYEDACNQMPRWVYAGGRKLAGLERRRAEEQAKCLGR
jgi:lysozyme